MVFSLGLVVALVVSAAKPLIANNSEQAARRVQVFMLVAELGAVYLPDPCAQASNSPESKEGGKLGDLGGALSAAIYLE
jgi:hypothetical protein